MISQTYDNYVKLNENDKIIREISCETQTQKISSGIWKSCFPSTFVEISFENTINCGFDMISTIFEKKTKTKMSVHELKIELFREYTKYLQNYQEQILEILSQEGKKH